MKGFGIFKRIVLNACLINTVLICALSALAYLFSSRAGFAPKLSTVAMILAFSFVISAAGYILSAGKLNTVVCVLIHYASIAAAFYMIFVVWGGFASRASTALIAMFFFTVIYAVSMIVYFIVKKKRSGKRKDSAEYSSEL